MIKEIYTKITKEYYSKWLGIEPCDFNKTGITAVCSSEREVCQDGYSQPFSVYLFKTNRGIILSYSRQVQKQATDFLNQLNLEMSFTDVKICMDGCFNGQVSENIKFVFDELSTTNDNKSKELTISDYQIYHDFFMKQNPNSKTDGWLQDYFDEMCSRNLCFGVIVNGELVCATDAPNMPYMTDKVQEIGINTLTEYHGKGYATMSAIACAKSLVSENICPLWSCAANNKASEKLAYNVGFTKLGDVLTI